MTLIRSVANSLHHVRVFDDRRMIANVPLGAQVFGNTRIDCSRYQTGNDVRSLFFYALLTQPVRTRKTLQFIKSARFLDIKREFG
jgi:hypothetical protein